jgi:hypothetical protein
MSAMSDQDIMHNEALQYAASLRRLNYSADILCWNTALDNYEPSRDYAHGYAVRYEGTLHDRDTGRTAEYPTAGITMFCDDLQLPLGNLISAGPHAVALFDYGNAVHPYYVAGWNPRETDKQRDPALHGTATAKTVMWHPFPTAQPGEMTHHKPPRPLDYSTWQLGPRRAYHFKVTRLPA